VVAAGALVLFVKLADEVMERDTLALDTRPLGTRPLSALAHGSRTSGLGIHVHARPRDVGPVDLD
jgi:hypothetical protein